VSLPRHLFTTTDAVGGVWSYALDLARGLAAEEMRVTLAVTGPPPGAAQAAAAAAIAGLELVVTGLPLDWAAEDAGTVLRAGAALAALASAREATLVQLNSPAYAAGGDFAQPLVIACHSCVASWWEAQHRAALPPDLRWRRDQAAAGYRQARRLVAPTAAFAATTARLYGLAQPPTVVANGRSPLPAPSAGAAAALPLPANFVFSAGRLWDSAKNFAALDAAAALLEWPVLAAGPLAGPQGGAIALPHLRLTGLLGPAAMARCYAEAGLFVSTARYEPFGLAVLEAAQAGCPLLLADLPGFREIWGDAASYLPDDRPTSLAVAIDRLMRDPAQRQARGAAARARAARYTVEAMQGGMLALYREAMQETLV
jgi:glycosyltransferase involved in cell wall biosynthesis